MRIYYLFIIIFSSLYRNSANTYTNKTVQMKFLSKPQLENNYNKSVETTIIPSYIENNEVNSYVNELTKNMAFFSKLHEQIDSKGKVETQGIMRQRKSRDTMNDTDLKGLECLSCLGDGISVEDENCYKGSQVKTEKCSDAEQCYTELHNQYIKRGCMLPGSLNRTFVCKCPLCNDKPSYDSIYYEYTKHSDWKYDNERLQTPIVGIDLICKVCETKGINKTIDNVCKLGRNADYMVCGPDQLCYINMDDQFDFVSRGCIRKPAYNTLHYFCNIATCNNVSYQNPKSTHPIDIMLRTPSLKGKLVSSTSCNKMNSFSSLFILVTILLRPIFF